MACVAAQENGGWLTAVTLVSRPRIERLLLRKRYYVLLVARDGEGQLRKIPIPLHYIYVFLAGALIGMFTITGMASSYARMLWKVASFNQLRSEKNALQSRYQKLEQSNHEKD